MLRVEAFYILYSLLKNWFLFDIKSKKKSY